MLVQFVQEQRIEKQTWNVARVQNGNAMITLSSQFNKNASDTRNKQNTNFIHISTIHYSFLFSKKLGVSFNMVSWEIINLKNK
jgi:hypothetical protein